ncbi:MAG TPA: cysteine desulfurase family protein [Longimicrobiales bacterium]
MGPIYLDHAATTPVRREVLDAMLPFFGERFGNPSSAHAFGRAARAALEEARERVAGVIGARRSEIVFTSGGTEADNLAVLGRARWALRAQGRAVVGCTATEHKAVLSAITQAAQEGARAVILGVDSEGRVALETITELLEQKPAVISVMWVNNEVGTVQPIEQIAERCAASDVVLHTDAVQAAARLPVRIHDGIGLLSMSGHKLGAPKGIGVLYIRDGVALIASQHGGSQERAIRPGTENIASAVGFSVALELAGAERAAESARLRALRDRLQHALVGAVPDLVVNAGEAERAPHILSVSVTGVEQDALLVSLDLEGIAVSTASACQSGTAEPSHVLVAMGRNIDDAAVLRMSLGRATTAAEIERAVQAIPQIIERVRALV